MTALSPKALNDEVSLLESRLAAAQQKKGQRETAILALWAVKDFLRAIPSIDSQNLWSPFFHLAVALEELKYGTVSPVLKPAKSANRHPQPAARKQTIALAIFYSDCLMKAGSSEPEACDFVAKLLSNQGFKLGGRRKPEASDR